MTTPLSDERRAEIRKRAEWEYALHAGQPRNTERGAILFLIRTSIDLLAEVDRLRARNAELVKVLRSVEWEPIYFTYEATIEDEPEICTRCHRRRTDGHAPDCELAAALRDAHE